MEIYHGEAKSALYKGNKIIYHKTSQQENKS